MNKQLSLAATAAQATNSPSSWANMVINTHSFAKAIFTVTGKDMTVFIDQWIRTGGHARFSMEFVFNRKRSVFLVSALLFGPNRLVFKNRNTVEMQINQEAASKGMRGVRKYVGPLTVAVQELDGWFSYTFAVENVNSKV